jgi:hypothetical protein
MSAIEVSSESIKAPAAETVVEFTDRTAANAAADAALAAALAASMLAAAAASTVWPANSATLSVVTTPSMPADCV